MDEWRSELTPEEKRQNRLNGLLDPQGVRFVNSEAERAYKIRARRYIDVYNVKEPDRVPVSMSLGGMPAYLYGTDYLTVIYDREKAAEVWTKFNNEHAVELDSFTSPALIFQGKVYDLLDYKLYAWPGHGLPETAIRFQYVEGEYMKADEYDALINDPSGYLMRVYLPRVFGAFEPFKMLAPITNVLEMPFTYFIPFAMPQLQATQQTLIDVGKEIAEWKKFTFEFNRRGMELGFPMSLHGGFVKAPFDALGDTLRGTKGIMMDMYRQPEKILEAVDMIANITIEAAIASVNNTKGLIVVFPLHKGADGWMNDKQFETFYWPSLKKVINALIEEGINVSLFAEGSFNTRLETVNEFPKGAVCWFFDKTDMARAKKILGDRCCIQGNVPSSLLVAGTPRDVKEHCRKLIEVCGKGGGYILSPGAVGIDEAKLDNLKAMVQAAKEFGVYK